MPALNNAVNTIAMNSDKILAQGDVIYNSGTTIKDVATGNWGQVPEDILYTLDSIFTERYITASSRNKNVNYDIDVDNITSKYDDKLTSKYSGNITSKYEDPEIGESLNNPNTKVVNNEAQIPRFGSEWNEYFKATYGEKNVSWVSNKLQLSKEVKSYMSQGQYSRAMDFHYEDLVRRKTGGISVDVNGRQIDSVTENAVIQAKRSISAIEKPDNFLDKKLEAK